MTNRNNPDENLAKVARTFAELLVLAIYQKRQKKLNKQNTNTKRTSK